MLWIDLLHLATRVLDRDRSGVLVARGVPGGLGRRGLEGVVVAGVEISDRRK